MAQEIGESREIWGWDVMKMAEDFANNMKSEVKPFYIVYAAKLDPYQSKKMGRGVYKQAMKAYYTRPAPMLGILVWFVNHPLGQFMFMPELSAPPDVPVDPSLLGEKAEDALPTVMEKGKALNVLVS
jgi:hypothetical protein